MVRHGSITVARIRLIPGRFHLWRNAQLSRQGKEQQQLLG
jgi:hypothetical protein